MHFTCRAGTCDNDYDSALSLFICQQQNAINIDSHKLINWWCLRHARLAGRGVMFSGLSVRPSICTSVRPFVRLLPNLWTRHFESEETMQIGTNGRHDQHVKRSTLSLWGSGRQRSRSYEAEDKFGGLTEASFSTPLFWVGFLFKNLKYL